MRKMYLTSILALLFCVHAVSPATGENLPDPTRPPAAFQDEVRHAGEPSSSAPVLQSVLIGPKRSIATISGRIVKLGDKLGDARVVKISETEVVLQSGSGKQTFKLFPDIEKKTSSSGMGNQGRHRRQ